MTGRDLILYIVENHLENEEIFKDGKFIGFLTVSEVAQYYCVGNATVQAWIKEKMVDSVLIAGGVYLPATLISKSTRGDVCVKEEQNC